jgi:hypothetical protein
MGFNSGFKGLTVTGHRSVYYSGRLFITVADCSRLLSQDKVENYAYKRQGVLTIQARPRILY